MSNLATASRRLADSLERLLSSFLGKDVANFKQALSEVRDDLPFVVGSLEPFGLEHANLLRQRVEFVMKRAVDAFDGTRIVSECIQNGIFHSYHQLTRNQIESGLKAKVKEAVASLRSWAAKFDEEKQGKAESTPHIPDDLGRIAEQVQQLIVDSGSFGWWQKGVLEWCRGDQDRSPQEYCPLPMGINRVEAFAILAAIHDHALPSITMRIGPYDNEDSGGSPTNETEKFLALRMAVRGYGADDLREIQAVLGRFRTLLSGPKFSTDFRSAFWNNQQFNFTLRQAACLSVMSYEWQGGDTILVEAAGHYRNLLSRENSPRDAEKKATRVDNELDRLKYVERFRDVFRSATGAWGTLIEGHPDKKNQYRIARIPKDFN